MKNESFADRRARVDRRRRHYVDPRFKIAYLMSIKKTESIVMLMLTSFLMAIGFFISQVTNVNYETIYAFAHPYFWGGIFFVTSMIHACDLWSRVDIKVKIINSIASLWAWSYIFLSFVVFDKTPIAPTEILLSLPIFIQSLVLTSALYCEKPKL